LFSDRALRGGELNGLAQPGTPELFQIVVGPDRQMPANKLILKPFQANHVS
jgi:hypothetical protein